MQEGREQPDSNQMLNVRVRQSEPLGKIPIMLTPFVGREQEVADVCALLERQEIRLLTLFGTGGVGKTRLALQVATEMRKRFSDDMCFVLLAALNEPELVFPAIAEALALQESGEQSIVAQCVNELQHKQLLLVLDNVEQVIAIAPQLEYVLASCSMLKIVVTSREVLRVSGEQVYPVLPLALPDLTHVRHDEDLVQYTAIALFIQRMHALLPTFQLTPTDVQAIAEICIRLDGLPLAIEIAAAQMRLFPPQALLSHLTKRRQFLKQSIRSLPARHQTLRNTLDWSYNLFSEDLQRLFRLLSIFNGGWTLEAVEALWHREDETTHEQLTALEGVAELLNKSLLIQAKQEGTEPYLSMLVTVREYGLDLLHESGEFDRVQQAHALYYLQWTEQATPHLKGPQQMLWKTRLEDEQENLRSALQWCIEHEQAELAYRFGGALGWFWYISGHWSEGRHWLEAALTLSHDGKSTVARARALCSLGGLANCQGEYLAARAYLEESVVLFRELQEPSDLSFALSILGATIADNDVATSRRLAAESVALARVVGEPWNLAFALYLQGLAIASPTTFDLAISLLGQSLKLFRQLDDKRQLTFALAQLGKLEAAYGNIERAEALCRESLALARTLGYKSTFLRTVYELAKVLRKRGDLTQATHLFRESIILARDLKDRCLETMIMQELAYLASSEGDMKKAGTLLQESILLYREMDETFLLVGALCDLGSLMLAQGERVSALKMFTESIHLSLKIEHIEAIGRSLIGLAMVATTQKQFQRAVRLFAVAESLAIPNKDLEHVERANFERSVNKVRTHLGEKAFAILWKEGQLLTPEQALAFHEDQEDPAPTTLYPFALTPREVEVLRLVSKGLTNMQIAEQLIVSPLTINAHLRSIYNKLDVTSRSAATRLAIEHHLV